MSLKLNQILSLVGRLDDSPGDETPRERFRRFLVDNVSEVGQIRDYLEECLRSVGEQYNRALQDLVNHLGRAVGFDVRHGRYQGAQGQIGFDGHWKSPTGFHLVVELKTAETDSVKTATLVNYVDQMISDQIIPSWDAAMGLYIIGRPDRDVNQLQNMILGEKRTHQLRVISAESLLTLAELAQEYEVSHEEVVAVLWPSGPLIDPLVGVLARLVAQPSAVSPPHPQPEVAAASTAEEEAEAYWLTPVKKDATLSAEEHIQSLVGKHRIYGIGEKTPGRKHLKAGDYICFYAVGKGVVAHARMSSAPEHKIDRRIRNPESYPWTFMLENAKLYLDTPVVVDAALRWKLDAFQGRDADQGWAWFVQATRRVTKHDFALLTSAVAV